MGYMGISLRAWPKPYSIYLRARIRYSLPEVACGLSGTGGLDVIKAGQPVELRVQGSGDPSLQILLNLGPEVYTCFLLWDIWIPRTKGSGCRVQDQSFGREGLGLRAPYPEVLP